jgi:hypothetical protein
MSFNYLCIMIAFFIIGGLFLIAACYLWVKLVFVLIDKLHNYIFRNKIKENQNPYIAEQKARMQNDQNFEEYEKWMRTKGDGIPLEKVITKDEHDAIEKIKKYLYD